MSEHRRSSSSSAALHGRRPRCGVVLHPQPGAQRARPGRRRCSCSRCSSSASTRTWSPCCRSSSTPAPSWCSSCSSSCCSTCRSRSRDARRRRCVALARPAGGVALARARSLGVRARAPARRAGAACRAGLRRAPRRSRERLFTDYLLPFELTSLLLLVAIVGAVVLAASRGRREHGADHLVPRLSAPSLFSHRRASACCVRRNADRHLHVDRADAERRQPDASSPSPASLGSMDGQVIVFFVMTVAAAEAAVGLAIIIAALPPPRDDQRRRADAAALVNVAPVDAAPLDRPAARRSASCGNLFLGPRAARRRRSSSARVRSLAAFVVGVLAVLRLHALPAETRAARPRLPVDPRSARCTSTSRSGSIALSRRDDPGRHRRRLPDPRLLASATWHDDPDVRALLHLPEPLRHRDADPGARRQPARCCSSAGRASGSAPTC